MTQNNIMTRLEALEKALKAPNIPRMSCIMRDGRRLELDGMTVLAPFLNGEIAYTVCDDANMAQMLRALDTERTTEIELLCVDGVTTRKEKI